jgi:hypothetical protein
MKLLNIVLCVFTLLSLASAVNTNYVTLKECNDPNKLMDLQTFLNSYRYTHEFDDDFNCAEFTTACAQFLSKNGYEVYEMALKFDDDQSRGHCYPIVKFKDGWVAIETTRDPDNKLGYIAEPQDSARYHYLTGIFLNSSDEMNDWDWGPDPVYTGDLTRFIDMKES